MMQNEIFNKYADVIRAKRGRPANGQRGENTRINVLIPTTLHKELMELQRLVKEATGVMQYNNGRGLFLPMEALVNLVLSKGLEQTNLATVVKELGIDEVKELQK